MNFNYALTRSDTGLQRRDDGLYYRANANEPIGVIGTDGRPIGAWIPKALTNLLLHSEDLSQSAWTKVTSTITTAAAVSFIQGELADRVTETSTSARVEQTVTVGSGATFTFGRFVKKEAGFDWYRMQVFNGANGYRAWFNLDTGAAGTVAVFGTGIAIGSGITDVGNGYYLCYVVGSIPATTSYTTWTLTAASNGSISSVNGSTRLETGAMGYQANLNGTLTLLDYIRTTGSSVARQLTDIRNPSFPELASLQGFIDIEINPDGVQRSLMCIGADNNNRLRFEQLTNGSIIMIYRASSTNVFQIFGGPFPAGRYRIAYYLSGGVNKIWVDGVELTSTLGDPSAIYVPLGSIKVLGGDITGTSNRLENGGFINEYITSGKSETELLAVSSFKTIEQLYSFKRLESDSLADLTALITTLQATTV